MNCRLCLSDNEDLLNIFGDVGKKLKVELILKKHFGWIEMTVDTCFSQHICKHCWTIVSDFDNLYSDIEQKHANNTCQIIETNILFPEVKTEAAENDFNFEFGDEAAASLVKTELVTIKMSDDEGTDHENLDVVLKQSKEKVKRTLVKKSKASTTNSSTSIDKIRTGSSDKTKDQENQIINESCKMKCELCNAALKNWPSISSHFQAKHNVKGYVRCVCCDKKFYRKSLLLDHIEVQTNPDAFKCTVCNKLFGHRHAVRAHMFYHKPAEEKPFSCDKCDKRFTHMNLLNQHLKFGHTTREDRKIKCSECEKCFLTHAILNNHIRVEHKGVYTKLCEICAKSFKTKLSYQSHMKHMHSDEPVRKIECEICGVWLKEKNMNSHMIGCKSKLDKEQHICLLCNKSYPNAKALDGHTRHVHKKEKIYQCSVCEKSFKRPLALKEHMSIHTGEILYTCPYCPKTCNSSSNMYQHKKTHTRQ